MHKHNSFSVSDVARHCHISESAFYTIFKEVTGHTPTEEKHRIQAEKAAEFAYVPIESIARKFHADYGDVYSQLKADKSTSWVFDNSKLLSAVPDFAPAHTLKDGIFQTLEAMQHADRTSIDARWSELCDELLK